MLTTGLFFIKDNHPRAPGPSWRRRQKDHQGGWEQCPLDMMGPLLSWAHSSCGSLHKPCLGLRQAVFQHEVEARKTQLPVKELLTVGAFWGRGGVNSLRMGSTFQGWPMTLVLSKAVGTLYCWAIPLSPPFPILLRMTGRHICCTFQHCQVILHLLIRHLEQRFYWGF